MCVSWTAALPSNKEASVIVIARHFDRCSMKQKHWALFPSLSATNIWSLPAVQVWKLWVRRAYHIQWYQVAPSRWKVDTPGAVLSEGSRALSCNVYLGIESQSIHRSIQLVVQTAILNFCSCLTLLPVTRYLSPSIRTASNQTPFPTNIKLCMESVTSCLGCLGRLAWANSPMLYKHSVGVDPCCFV